MGDLISDMSFIHIVTSVNLPQFDSLFFNLQPLFLRFNKNITLLKSFTDDAYYNPHVLDHNQLTIHPTSKTSEDEAAGVSISMSWFTKSQLQKIHHAVLEHARGVNLKPLT